ncbi:MAG: MBL fold metallo-hydrolase [Actinomycetota bacterium]|nr:MBL fold metallo-hydrolase [Actinomycetota bacterium]
MLFRQFVDDDLGCASYLIGDPAVGVAVVVDPAYAIEQYLEAASAEGVRIVRTLETHTHADHVSGHGRLALEQDVPVSIHPLGEPEYPSDELHDEAELEVGTVTVRVIHTPGHRPEHCALAVIDRARGPQPQLVLTGDSLFVGAIGRPDLAVGAREGAEGMFHSLRRLLELPDGATVYPGHVAGSLCGASMSAAPRSSIGAERADNDALAVDDREEFVALALSSSAPRPPNMDLIVELNRGPFLGAQPPLQPLADPSGLTVLDVRPAERFAEGHVSGAINIPVDGSSFATKAGFLLKPAERIAIHASSLGEAEKAARSLRAVGFLELAGVLDAPEADATIDPIGLDELEELFGRGEVRVLDVRESDERDDGYIAGSEHMPYRLTRVCGEDLGGGTPVVTICESGARAGIAASVLASVGVEARPVLGCGIPDWQARGGRTIEFRRCGT